VNRYPATAYRYQLDDSISWVNVVRKGTTRSLCCLCQKKTPIAGGSVWVEGTPGFPLVWFFCRNCPVKDRHLVTALLLLLNARQDTLSQKAPRTSSAKRGRQRLSTKG
jgi:hypothetical protein